MKCFVLHKVLEFYVRFFVFVLHLNMLDWVYFFWWICQSYRNSHVLICLLFLAKWLYLDGLWSFYNCPYNLSQFGSEILTLDFFIALKMSFLVGLKKQIVLLILLYSFSDCIASWFTWILFLGQYSACYWWTVLGEYLKYTFWYWIVNTPVNRVLLLFFHLPLNFSRFT